MTFLICLLIWSYVIAILSLVYYIFIAGVYLFFIYHFSPVCFVLILLCEAL